MSQPQHDPLFRPLSIAVIGASNDTWQIGGRPLALLRHIGFSGQVAAVHPRLKEAVGYACYATVGNIPFVPELAILAVGARHVLPVLHQCREKGIRAAVVFASGFADAGSPEGRMLQQELRTFAIQSGIRILGPNTLGFIDFDTRTGASFAAAFHEPEHVPLVGGTWIIGQGGGACITLFNTGLARGIGFSKVVMTGNEACLGFLDMVDVALDDPGATCILGYVEGIDEPERLRALAAKAASVRVPIILLKAGNTPAGARAALSHTARMTGDGAIARAGFDRLNLVETANLEEMVELAYLARFMERNCGRRGVVITASGAMGAILADLLTTGGLQIDTLSADLQARLRRCDLAFASTANPIDLSANIVNNSDGFAATLRLLIESKENDFVLLFATGGVIDSLAPVLLAEVARSDKLVAVMLTGRCQCQTELEEAGIPVMGDISRGAAAVAKLVKWQDGLLSFAPLPMPSAAKFSLSEELMHCGPILDEHKSKLLLRQIGVPVTRERLCLSLTEAKSVAADLGFPVVMKAVSDTLIHKTEAGAVRLGIGEDEVEATFEELIRLQQGDVAMGVLVQEQIAPRLEIMISARIDPLVGPAITVAAGGVNAEIVADMAHSLLPLDDAGARALLAKLRLHPLLAGYRGKAPLCVDALVSAMLALSGGMMALCETVNEIEINPLILSEQSAVAVDAFVRLRTFGGNNP